MTRLIGPILIGVSTAGADALGAKYIEGAPVGITTAIAMAVFVGSAVLWLDGKFRERDKAQAEHAMTIASRLSEQEVKIASRLARIEQKLNDLPCPGRGAICRTDDEI